MQYDQSRITEQTKFTYSPLSKAFEKQMKTIEDQGIKQTEALKTLKQEKNKEDIKSIEKIFPKEMKTNEIKNEIDEIKKWEEKIKAKDLIYKVNKCKYGFQHFVNQHPTSEIPHPSILHPQYPTSQISHITKF